MEDAKQKIELQIIQEEMKHPLLSREDVTYWICRFRTLDVTQLEERRRLIDSFVNAVTIFDDYILITFNYKEGSERVTFDEIKSSDLKLVGGPWRGRQGTSYSLPSFEGGFPLYRILMRAWRHRSCGAIFLKKFYYILWYEVELWKNPLLTFCKPLT